MNTRQSTAKRSTCLGCIGETLATFTALTPSDAPPRRLAAMPGNCGLSKTTVGSGYSVTNQSERVIIKLLSFNLRSQVYSHHTAKEMPNKNGKESFFQRASTAVWCHPVKQTNSAHSGCTTFVQWRQWFCDVATFKHQFRAMAAGIPRAWPKFLKSESISKPHGDKRDIEHRTMRNPNEIKQSVSHQKHTMKNKPDSFKRLSPARREVLRLRCKAYSASKPKWYNAARKRHYRMTHPEVYAAELQRNSARARACYDAKKKLNSAQ